MRRAVVVLATLTVAVTVSAACSEGKAKGPSTSMDALVRLNQVQVIGTHNSFHRRMPPKLLSLLGSVDAGLAASVDYEHRPLDAQLDGGIRQLELDVWADTDGGRYASRAANPLAGLPKASGLDELARPGFKVLHLPEVDYESSCLSFRACLRTVADWSSRHPHHLPIMVFVEAKDAPVPDVARLGFAVPEPIGAAQLDSLDGEIRSVFGAGKLLTPDDVRGSKATLREAVVGGGWPTLAASRGKVLFCLLNDDAKRTAYIDGHPSLRGRTMFTLSGVGSDESAVVSRPQPVQQAASIAALVRQGFLVRTRADADVVEARAGDVTRRDAALASGATWISTDFPVADPTFGNGYAVGLPGGAVARCSPLVAPPACRSDRLEPAAG